MLLVNLADRERKWCTGCGDQPRDAFTAHLGRADGLADRCRACRKRERAQLYVLNKAAIRAKNDAWAAANQEKKKAADKRHHETRRAERLVMFAAHRAATRDQRRAADRAYYALNRPARLVAMRIHVRRRRARKAQATLHEFSSAQLDARVAVFGDQCAYCGEPWAHIDHVKPLARGGSHCLANFRPSCAGCNMKKGSQHHLAWLRAIVRPPPLPLP